MTTAGRLVLEDGRVFPGHFFGKTGDYYGEVCFNTSLTGYQEILTDPSYTGQIVTLTVPHVGNTGVNDIDFESLNYRPSALIIRELANRTSSFRSQSELSDALAKAGVGGLQGVETRALTLHIRNQGALQGLVTDSDASVDELVQKIKDAPRLGDEDQVLKVTCKEAYDWTEGLDGPFAYPTEAISSDHPLKVAVMDFGVKHNILRLLVASGCQVRVFPATTKAAEILAQDFDGVFLSNGPGDPATLPYAVAFTKEVIGKLPVFGICLGHQLIGRALGGDTFKLKFGHRGGNHPVKDLQTGRVEITSQNHGYALKDTGLDASVEITHINLNDQTVEGLIDRSRQVFSVQYHPESAPGPHDSSKLFDWFIEAMGTEKASGAA